MNLVAIGNHLWQSTIFAAFATMAGPMSIGLITVEEYEVRVAQGIA